MTAAAARAQSYDDPGTGLVRYDAVCRAIDAAYQVDEVKAIHDTAAMLQAAARVAHNIDAETRAYEIRMRAARKANQPYDAGEKAKRGPDESGRGSQRSNSPTSEKPLKDFGISKQEMSEWRKVAVATYAESPHKSEN
jgi:hypothetical protein